MLDSAPLPTSLERPPWKRMVVVGDSVAAGVREPLAEIRESQLADALAFAPDIAMVIAGGNDALGHAVAFSAVVDSLGSWLSR